MLEITMTLRSLLRKSALLLSGLALAVVGACTSSGAEQCSVGASGDLDCERVLGVASGQAFCDVGTCRPKGNPPPAQNDTDAGPTASPCVSTAQCTTENGNRPSICREPGVKPCVPLANDDCTVSGDGWKQAKNPVFVGVLLSKTSSADNSVVSYSVTNEKGIRLAEEEWLAETTGGLNVGGERRPIVNVYCDIKNDPDTARKYFDFVTLGVDAQAVITDDPHSLAWFLDSAQQRGTFVYLSEFGCDDIAPTGKLNGLCFTNVPPFDFSRPMMKEWVKATEAQVRTQRAIPLTTKIKAVLLAARQGQTASTSTFIDGLNADLEINGQPASAQPTLYKEMNPQVLPDGTVDYVATAKTVAAFAPDIIVTLEARDFHLWYMPLIESNWSTALSYRPHYVGTDNIAFARRFAVSVGGNEALRHRVNGVWTALDNTTQPVFDDFMTRYEARYGQPNIDRVASGYDAFNATAYGIAAALTSSTVQANALKGTDIGQGMKRLSSGTTTTNLEPKLIPAALATLANGGSIDLVGAVSAMDWNPVNGCPDADSSVFCVYRDVGQGLYVDDLGFRYRYKTKTFDPPLPFSGVCP
jgi:hypothetical protein